MIQAIAGSTGEFPRLACLQHVGKGVAEVVTIKLARFVQFAAVQGPAAEVEFQRPALAEPEGAFELAGGGVQQRWQCVLFDQCHRQIDAGVQFLLHPSH